MSSEGLELFSRTLKNLRVRDRVSQAQLAKAIMVSSGTVAHWERAKNFPTQETVWKLCDYFKVSQDELFGKSLDIPAPYLNSQMELTLSPTDQELANLIAESRGISTEDAIRQALRECVSMSMQEQRSKQSHASGGNTQREKQGNQNLEERE